MLYGGAYILSRHGGNCNERKCFLAQCTHSSVLIRKDDKMCEQRTNECCNKMRATYTLHATAAYIATPYTKWHGCWVTMKQIVERYITHTRTIQTM